MTRRHLLSIADLDSSDLLHLVERAQHFATSEDATSQDATATPLRGRAVGLLFRNTSTRTRTSFAIGAAKLGAATIVYGPNDLQTNTGETLEDTARVLSGFLDALVVRSARDDFDMHRLATQDQMAIINAMSPDEHPTQALADLATMRAQFGRLDGLSVVYLGEGNNSATALALAVSRIRGMQLRLFTPEGYGLPPRFLERASSDAARHGAHIEEHHRIDHLPAGDADVVYTTRWETTGTVKPDPDWRTRFAPFQVTQALMARVSKPSGTVFMHDLPAVRGQDVEAAVIDGPQSIVFQQARFKMFSAMAALEWSVQSTSARPSPPAARAQGRQANA